MKNKLFNLHPEYPPCCGRRTMLEVGAILSLFVAGFALSAIYAYYTIFALFTPYDDEGFMLMSLKSFFQGHALYDEVYSCYQPFFHVFNWLVFGLSGAPLCHDNIRILAITLWLMVAAFNAVVAYRFTSSSLLALLVLLQSIVLVRVFAKEPGHPGGLACLLVVMIVALFAFMDRLPRIAFALALGFLLGFLLLTKINVGVYVFLPAVLVLAAGTAGIFFIRLQAVAGLAMIALPAVLMHSRLTQLAASTPGICALALLACVVAASFVARSGRAVLCVILAAGVDALALICFRSSGFPVLYLAVLVTLSIASVVLISYANRPGIGIEPRIWMWAALCGGVAMVAILLAVVLRGTSMQGLLNGLFRGPLTQSKVFYYTCPSNLSGGMLALGGFAACCGYVWSKKSWADRRSFRVILAMTKLLFGLLVAAWFSPLKSFIPFHERLLAFWMLPFAWLAVESETGSPTERMGRLALVAVAVMQPLIAYPVAGAQRNFASALTPVIAVVCLADALRALVPCVPGLIRSRWLRLAVGGIAGAALLYGFGLQARQARWNYFSHTPLDLPGASRIRLTNREVRCYQDLVRPLARPEVETFLTLPGLNSLYFWAQKEPPTGFNVTAWMFVLDDRCQERIWEEASKHRGLMAVRSRYWTGFWTQRRPFDHLPLVQHIDRNFQTVEVIDGYELMVRR